MTHQPKKDVKLVTSDGGWKLGDPATIEPSFHNLLLTVAILP